MRLSFFDTEAAAPKIVQSEIKKLAAYRTEVKAVVETNNSKRHEYALTAFNDLSDTLTTVTKQYKNIKHLIVIGIGGSSLGLEAVHTLLGQQQVKLYVLDTIAAYEIDILMSQLKGVKKVSDVAVCVISKSGGTTETVVNAAVVLEALKEKWGDNIYKQTIFIGDPGTAFLKEGKRLGATIVPMPPVVGGRYSVGTVVGLIPLALLQHDTEEFMAGLAAANSEEYESVAAEGAARLAAYSKKKFQHYCFFAFDKRLALVGAWYRQLMAESLGKEKDVSGKPATHGFLPHIATPVDLHSIGQLYLSNYPGLYTDFVTFDDEVHDLPIPKKGLGKAFGRFTTGEVVTGLYGGVVGAYTEKQLPHRATIFDEDLTYSIGLFMGLRMREIIYAARLLNLNAFDQPNVELYKVKTKQVLGL